MANEILTKIDEFGEAVAQMREANDKRLEELEKGNEAKAKEFEIKAEKWNKQIDLLQNTIGDLNREKEQDKARIEILEALSDRPKGTPTEQMEHKHLQLWEKWVRGKMEDHNIKNELKDIQRKIMESKADSVLTGTALQGGNAVPTQVGTMIETLILKQSEIVANVKNLTVGTSDYSELVTIAGANGGWSAETGSRSQSNAPNLRKVSITHGELYAYPKVSDWSLNDIFFDVVSWLQNDIAETMAVTLSTAIYSGDGSSKPTGMTNTAPTSGDDYASPLRAAAVYEYVPCGNSPVTSLVGDDLIDLQYTLRAGYQSNAKWAMNSTTQGAVRKLKDSYGQYLWQTNYQAGQPPTLLGKPIITWEDLGNTTSANAFPAAYGDFSRAYLLAKIGSMQMTVDNVTAPGYVNFYSRQRYGGIPLNNDAIKLLKMAAS